MKETVVFTRTYGLIECTQSILGEMWLRLIKRMPYFL